MSPMSLWLLVLGLEILVILAVLQVLIGRLRTSHAMVWEQLGRPSVLKLDVLNRFLKTRRYLEIGDPAVSRLSRLVVWARRAVFASVAVWFIWMLSSAG